MQHNGSPYDNKGQVVVGQPTNAEPYGVPQNLGPQVSFIRGPHTDMQNAFGAPTYEAQNLGFNNSSNAAHARPQAAGVPHGQVVFMDRPPTIPGVPPGLEYLSRIDQLLIHQQVEIFEMITGWETSNKYQIKNTLGQQVYFAGEESDACGRLCCGPQRGFVMHITDNFGGEVMRATRKFKCCAGCNCCANFNCCAMELAIEAPVGQVCGYVRQTRSCMAAHYTILDAHKDSVFKIVGPTCICQGVCCTQDQKFKVYSLDGSIVGSLNKQWSGFGREFFTDADNFSATFPIDLDVRMKAVLLCTVFLIDFMYFEQKQNYSN